MKIIFVCIRICLLLSFTLISNYSFNQSSTKSLLIEYCNKFNELNNKIRDLKISEKDALIQFQSIIKIIKDNYYKDGGKDYKETQWCFPVQHYNFKAIGGINGSGYIASKYNYFDGNKHLGHPAHDIFINDKNQDCFDDKTKQQVNILSMTGGVVIATYTFWKSGNNLRGGNYIWIYDPYSNSLYYYAHNNKIMVKIGDIIKPNEIIATMGRTGLNANKKTSPTHLHFMQLKLDKENYPRPYNFYNVLIRLK